MEQTSPHTLESFLQNTHQQDRGAGLFELETERFLETNLDGMVWLKMGAMIAYRGAIKFTREGMLDRGVGHLFKKAISGEGGSFTKAEGKGKLYLADSGKKITLIQLQEEAICVNGNDILAFEPSVTHDIQMMKKITAMMAGGLFNVKLSGSGMIAITSHHQPLTLQVRTNSPVITDPNATIAWSANLEPNFRKDVSFKTFIGRGSGESIQMEFKGEGFVVVQPFEEATLQSS